MVRALTPEDAAAMAAIHAQSFPVGWPASDMRNHIAKDLALGIGSPVEGFILVQIGGDQADILTIATDPKHRRKGHGKCLLASTEQVLKQTDVKTLYLDVSEINESAIALYKKAGYIPVGRRPAYYRTPKGRVAALTFSKTLSC